MIAVLFEVELVPGREGDYLGIAADLRPLLEQIDGFISIERFQSLNDAGKLLSLSFWRDESAIREWRNVDAHRKAQAAGRAQIFMDYKLHIAEVLRDYGMNQRDQAPSDSVGAFKSG